MLKPLHVVFIYNYNNIYDQKMFEHKKTAQFVHTLVTLSDTLLTASEK